MVVRDRDSWRRFRKSAIAERLVAFVGGKSHLNLKKVSVQLYGRCFERIFIHLIMSLLPTMHQLTNKHISSPGDCRRGGA